MKTIEIKGLEKVLWDIPASERGNLPDDFLIKRILSYGGVSLIFRAKKKFGKKKVLDVFNRMSQRSILKRKYYYIKKFLLE